MRLNAMLGGLGVLWAGWVAVPTELAAATPPGWGARPSPYAVAPAANHARYAPRLAPQPVPRQWRPLRRPPLAAAVPRGPVPPWTAWQAPRQALAPRWQAPPRSAWSVPSRPPAPPAAYRPQLPAGYGPPPRGYGYASYRPALPYGVRPPQHYRPPAPAWTAGRATPRAVPRVVLDPRFRPVREDMARRALAAGWRPVARYQPAFLGPAGPWRAAPAVRPAWAQARPAFAPERRIAGARPGPRPGFGSAAQHPLASDPRFRPWRSGTAQFAPMPGSPSPASAPRRLPGWLTTERFGSNWQTCAPCTGG